MITSMQNPKIQHIRSLLAKRKAREVSSSFVVEGVRIMEDALDSGQLPDQVFFSDQISKRGKQVLTACSQKNVQVYEISQRLMNSISDTQTSQGLMAIFPITQHPVPPQPDTVLILDNIRDPGNLGTLLRTAVAANVQLMLLTPGTTDKYSPKVLRAGMGAHFKIPVLYKEWNQIVKLCKVNIKPPLRLLLAEAAGGTSCWETDLEKPVALIIGSEAIGASQEALLAADETITIPTAEKSESLNAAVAGSILLFEIIRQRKL